MEKVVDLFSRRPLNTQAKTAKLINHSYPPTFLRPPKIILQISLLAVPEGALTTYPYKLCPIIFFSAIGVHVHPVLPLATPVYR